MGRLSSDEVEQMLRLCLEGSERELDGPNLATLKVQGGKVTDENLCSMQGV